jgi:arabinofuranosyltransferase
LFLALVVCASLAFDKRMDGVTGVLCGLASLTRPEGAAMVFVFAAIYVHKWRAIPWRMLCASALVAIPWFAYSYVQFGHVLPNSVAIKAAQHQVGWFKTQPTWFLTFLGQARHPWATYPLALVGVGALVKTYLKTRESFFLPIIMFALVQIAVYSIMSAPSGYFWYYAIGNMAVDLCVALGLMAVWRAAQSRMRKMESTTWSMWGFGVVMIVLSGVFSMAGFKSLRPMRLSVEYTAAGQWIAVNTPLNAVVAAAEIGYIGHYSGREIRDMHGLIHPGALAFIKKEQWDWWFVEHRPGVIVTHQPRWDGEPDVTRGWRQENHDAFLRDYRLVQEFGAVQVYVAADQCLAGKLAENPN